MLHIQNISKSFGGVTAVDGCTFRVEQGKITALIGPNGAGKTTLFDIISGLIRADHGKIIFKNENILGLLPYEIANRGIARTFQQVRLFKNLTLLDHLVLAEYQDDVRLIKQIFSCQKVSRDQRKKYAQWLEEFGISKKLDDIVSDLSYGQRKLLQMAMAFSKPHTLLLLDEPVAGVNKVIQTHIEHLLLGFKKKGETIVIIDHDMNFVRRLADHIVVLDSGRLLTHGAPEEVLNDSRVVEAYLGK